MDASNHLGTLQVKEGCKKEFTQGSRINDNLTKGESIETFSQKSIIFIFYVVLTHWQLYYFITWFDYIREKKKRRKKLNIPYISHISQATHLCCSLSHTVLIFHS